MFRHMPLALSIAFLTSPGKASGKSTDSLVTAVGRREEHKKISLDFTQQSVALLGKSQTLLLPATHFSLCHVVAAEEAYSETLPGNVAPWLEEGLVNLPTMYHLSATHVGQLQTDVKTPGRPCSMGGTT